MTAECRCEGIGSRQSRFGCGAVACTRTYYLASVRTRKWPAASIDADLRHARARGGRLRASPLFGWMEEEFLREFVALLAVPLSAVDVSSL